MGLFTLIRHFKDMGITGPFTRWYDKNTRENRIAEMQFYAREVAGHVQEKAHILEVAPGPGYLSIELAKMGNYTIIGMDISADFVEIGKTNAARNNVAITFVQGNVSTMPFEENTFDFLVCSAAFKNFKEPVAALKEMHRVLKVGGIGLIIDMRRDATKEALQEEAAKISRSGFERMFMVQTFKGLCKYAYTKKEFEAMIKQTPFIKTEIKESNIGFYIYLYRQ
ncbi:MAG: class I SAM-dependent methyltransferase [Spirochaetaceae bacterium]|jgi:ubiquinone/menaquinone biosynthesis C-methylase UbiE|nr:class I SAM-dependent methyltransferase [Spirochaetaceae bacterium]